MTQFDDKTNDSREQIKIKLREYFDGKIVRKDLTKKIKEGANVGPGSCQSSGPEFNPWSKKIPHAVEQLSL